MNHFSFLRSPGDVNMEIVDRLQARRKEKKLTQVQLSQRSNVSLSSLKRFEQTGEISLSSLIKLSFALGCEDDFDTLFSRKGINPAAINSLNRLARECKKMFETEQSENRDDHSKNFSFLIARGKWQLSPAYDLTYSSSIGGEHATTVNGNGRDPGMEDLLAVAKQIKFDKTRAKRIAGEIREIVSERLSRASRSLTR